MSYFLDDQLVSYLWSYFGWTCGMVLVNIVMIGWTGILIHRKSPVYVSLDPNQKRRKAADTIVLLGFVFLITNITCFALFGEWALGPGY